METTQVTEFERQHLAAPISAAERLARMANPSFGTVFVEHMVTIRFASGKGWHAARTGPFEPIPFSPAAAVLHYGQQIFEGLKAYRGPEGSALLFRPEANARRFRASARRLAMPELPEELFLGALRELVRVDHDWLPSAPGTSLYLRPFQLATEAHLGVRPATEYLFGVIACPVGAAFPGGSAPLTVWISAEHTRAAPGGTGAAKCGGNYAAAMIAQAGAVEAGCDQVVFLDSAEHRYVDELAGMNVFFVLDDGTLITPPLTGAILPGITRDSIIVLARAAGHDVVERPYSMAEWRVDAASGRLSEAFACGTAAVITPIGRVRCDTGEFVVGEGTTGPITAKLHAELTGIQYGRIADTRDWVRPID